MVARSADATLGTVASKGLGSGRLMPQSILIVEDHAATREALVQMLRGQGYIANGVASSLECLKLLDEGARFDLLVVDLVMPSLSGFLLGQMARKRRHDQNLLYISGFRDALSEDELERAGAPVLAKPMRMSEFIENVQQVLATGDHCPEERPG
jgi:two-component system, cell cycle sensor histidine kinase and response regulator CckA